MRSAFVLLALALSGCGGTVYRIEGEPLTPGGTAQTACESKDWLVLAPTRAQIADDKTKLSHRVTGLGLYRVGSDSPESIPSLALAPSPAVERKREFLEPYDQRRIIAASLGIAGIVAMAVGTVLFVNAFGSKTTPDASGAPHESHPVDGTKAGLGGALVGVGFGLGIGGLVVNPTNAEDTEARATRYMFSDPPDDVKSVSVLTETYNASVRQTCAAAP